MKDFSGFIREERVIDIGYSGLKFTKSNKTNGLNTKYVRLDRVLMNPSLGITFPDIDTINLPNTSSDPNPLLIKSTTSNSFGPEPFMFKKMWYLHQDFHNFIKDNLNLSGFLLNPLIQLELNISNIKSTIKWWNFSVFGNIQQRIKEVQTK